MKTDCFLSVRTTLPTPANMKSFIKRFYNDVPYEDIRREARFQRRAHAVGVSPNVIRCNHTSIVMENLNEVCIADKYGEDIADMPEWVKDDILDILYLLYSVVGIEYVDVTPYNFIEKDGVVWIVDFGHARNASAEMEPYLEDMFTTWKLSKWNSDFV